MGRAKEHPDRMMSDIEQRWCRDCQQYWNIKNFYLDCEGGDYGYCKEHQLERNRKTKAMYKMRQEIARGRKPKAVRKPKPKPKEETHDTITPEYVHEQCKRCRSYSRYDARLGWCMRHRKTVKGKDACGQWRDGARVEYQMEAMAVSTNGNNIQ